MGEVILVPDVERHDGGRRAKITLMPSLPNMHYKKIPTLATYTGLADTATCNKLRRKESGWLRCRWARF